MNRVVRRCFLLGTDDVSGKNYDHRKAWIEALLERFAACFGIDLIGFSILSNHFHLVLRSRPDVVATWDDTEVARRWWRLCPGRKQRDGTAEEPRAGELDVIRNNPQRLTEIRHRLSHISWWMRLLCQQVATRANREDGECGKFWQSRFRAVRLLDEESLLACAAYVDLNPIRAALAETLEESEHTSVQRRVEAFRHCGGPPADRFLAPVCLEGPGGGPGPCPHAKGYRCSNKGFVPLSAAEYLQLLDWTARQTVSGKAGATPDDAPPVLRQLSLEATTWCRLVGRFGRLFSQVAGRPRTVDGYRSPVKRHRFHLRRECRRAWAAAA
jgi:hypothetical protein